MKFATIIQLVFARARAICDIWKVHASLHYFVLLTRSRAVTKEPAVLRLLVSSAVIWCTICHCHPHRSPPHPSDNNNNNGDDYWGTQPIRRRKFMSVNRIECNHPKSCCRFLKCFPLSNVSLAFHHACKPRCTEIREHSNNSNVWCNLARSERWIAKWKIDPLWSELVWEDDVAVGRGPIRVNKIYWRIAR